MDFLKVPCTQDEYIVKGFYKVLVVGTDPPCSQVCSPNKVGFTCVSGNGTDLVSVCLPGVLLPLTERRLLLCCYTVAV